MSVSIYVGTGSEDDLNVANANFLRLWKLLDEPVDPEWMCGDYSGEALLVLQAKVRCALGMVRGVPALDAGESWHESHEGNVHVIECGLSAGWFENRLSHLLATIETAIESGELLRYA